MPEEEADMSEALMSLVDTALDHALESIKKGGPLVPFVMTENGETRNLRRHMVGGPDSFDLGKSVAEAKKSAKSLRADRVAVAYDGRMRSESGEKVDVIIIDAFERGAPFTMVIIQQYKPWKPLRKLEVVDDPMVVEHADPLY